MIALKFSLLIISPAVEVNTKTKEKQKTKEGWKSAWYRVCRFPKRVEFFYRHKICWYESFAAYHLLESVVRFCTFDLNLGCIQIFGLWPFNYFDPYFGETFIFIGKGFWKSLCSSYVVCLDVLAWAGRRYSRKRKTNMVSVQSIPIVLWRFS